MLPLPSVRVHEAHLQQLFQNLVGNAIKYHSPDRPPEVRVTAEQRSGFWIFSVASVVAVFARGGHGGGTGVLISDDGYALTNFHVVQPTGPTIRAHHTATTVAMKQGFLAPEASAWLGQVHVIDLGMPRALLADTLRERSRLGVGLGPELPPQARGKLLEQGQRPRAVAGEGQPPQPHPHRRLGTPVESAGPPHHVICHRQVPVGEELLRPAYQHLYRAPAPVLALRSQPRLELGGARYAEPLEEFSMHEVRRTGVIAGRPERLEPIDIELNGVGRYPYLRVI